MTFSINKVFRSNTIPEILVTTNDNRSKSETQPQIKTSAENFGSETNYN